MLRIFIFIIGLILPLFSPGMAYAAEKGKDEIISLIQQYKGKEGFEVVNPGSLGTAAIKSAVRIAAAKDDDDDAGSALKVIRGINRFAVVEYKDCDEKTRRSFSSKLTSVLNSSELIMEVKNDGNNMKMYGIVDEKTSKVHDFIMFSPEDCTLICLFGSIPMDAIAVMAQ